MDQPSILARQMGEFQPLLDINRAGGRAELAFVDLLETVSTGTPAYAHRYGRGSGRTSPPTHGCGARSTTR